LEGVSDLTTIASALMTAAEAKVESGSLGSTSMGSWSVPIFSGEVASGTSFTSFTGESTVIWF
jgi:hypothetical protein